MLQFSSINFYAFRRSVFFLTLIFISDLYKTVSVKIFGFLLRRITVDAAQFGHRYGFYRFRLKCCGRCRSIHPSLFLAFSYAGRKALSAEKLLIFCSSELSDKLWRAVGVPGFCFAVHRTRLLSFFECTSQVRRRLSARSFSPSLRLYYSRCFG